MINLKIKPIIITLLILHSLPLHAKAILVLGDSLSAGYGIYIHNGWVQLLQNRLSTMGQYDVVNASISGETTEGGLARLPLLLTQHQPHIVIIELGANDGFFKTPTKKIKQNLQTMITLSRKSGAKVLLAGMRLPNNNDVQYMEKFTDIYKELFLELNISLVPYFFNKVRSVDGGMQADGIHPSSASQPQLLANVFPYLKPMLSEPNQQ
jgi:acyl-CoA thioesterase-1